MTALTLLQSDHTLRKSGGTVQCCSLLPRGDCTTQRGLGLQRNTANRRRSPVVVVHRHITRRHAM